MELQKETLLKERQVADILGVHFMTVRGWRRAGKITHLRFSNGSIRFRPRDIEEFKHRSEVRAYMRPKDQSSQRGVKMKQKPGWQRPETA